MVYKIWNGKERTTTQKTVRSLYGATAQSLKVYTHSFIKWGIQAATQLYIIAELEYERERERPRKKDEMRR